MYYGRINPCGGYLTEFKGTVRPGMLTIADIYDDGKIDGVVVGKILDHTVHHLYNKKIAERVFASSVEVKFAGCVYQTFRTEASKAVSIFIGLKQLYEPCLGLSEFRLSSRFKPLFIILADTLTPAMT